jgi:hypothetical protein
MAPTFAVAESERQATPTLIARIEEDETAPDSEDAWGYDPLTVGFRVAEGVLLVLLLGLAMATAVVMIQRRRARR